MANETQTPDETALYEIWKDRIKAAVKFRDKVIDRDDFKTYSNYYKGRFFKGKSKSPRIAINVVYSNTTTMQSALAAKDPWVAFKARKEILKTRETICEEALNNEMQDIGFRFTLKKVIRDNCLNGYGVAKCGYFWSAEEEAEKGTNVEQTIVYHDAKEGLYFNLIPSQYFLLDPTAKEGLKDSTFVVEAMLQRKSYLEKKYSVDLKDCSSVVPDFLKDVSDNTTQESLKIFELMTVYECWDIIQHKRFIVIDGYDKKVFTFEWPYGITRYPYVLQIFNDAPEEPYGISDVSLYRTQQEELNMMASVMAEHVKKNNCKWTADPDMIDRKEAQKMLENETGSVLMGKAGAVQAIQPHQMSIDFMQYKANLMNDIKEIIKITDNMRGGSSQHGKKTARQVYSEDFYSRLGMSDRQQVVNEFVLESADLLFEIMENNYTLGKMVEVVGPDGKYIAKEYKGEKMSKDFDKIVQQGTGAQNKPYMADMVAQGLKLTMGNPLLSPKEWTDIIIDVFFDGLDTSKLMLPNAEQIATDPIAREQWRQMMLTVASQTRLQGAISAIQKTGQPAGAPAGGPAQTPQPPGGNPSAAL